MPERQHPEEILLLRQARKGDLKAFGELYDHYAPMVYRFFAAHTHDKLDAEDLTEDVFIKVWKALPGYRERGVPFGGYLFRVARNALTDHYRRSGRNGTHLPIDENLIPDDQADPAKMMAAQLERQQVQKVLSQLSKDYRTVLSLRFLSGLSPDEVAVAMRKSPGAVRVLQHRALKALRKLMDGKE